MITLDASPLLRPLLDTAAEYRREWGTIEASIEEVLEENESLQLRLEEKSAALAEAEQHLRDERGENRRLLKMLEQQESRLADVLAQMQRLEEKPAALAEVEKRLAEAEQRLTDERTENRRLTKSREEQEARLAELVEQLRATGNDTPAVSFDTEPLLAEIRQENGRLLKALEAATSQPDETPIFKLLEQQETRLAEALVEMRRLGEAHPATDSSQTDARKLETLLEQQESRLAEALVEIRRLAEHKPATNSGTTDIRKIEALFEQQEARQIEALVEIRRLADEMPDLNSHEQPAFDIDPLVRLLEQQETRLAELRTEIARLADEKSHAIANVEEKLTEERSENRRLSTVLEQQDTRLSEALTEMRRLADEQHQLQQALLLAAESSLAVSEEMRESGSHAVDTTSAATAEITNELKELRRLFEEQSSRWQELAQHSAENVRQSSAAPPAPVPATFAPPSEEPAAGNPVVNSVMAQFAKLQKDVAQRKKKR